MKSLVFDSSAIISLATNNLLWILRHLKKQFKGDFYISNSIKKELVNYPLTTKKFKFEAIAIKDLIDEGILKLYNDKKISEEADELLNICNKIFIAKNNYINLVEKAEVEGLVLAKFLDSDAFVVDERTIRLLIELINNQKKILESKLHTIISVNKNNLDEFKKRVSNIKVIRSTELATIAYEMKLLDKYITAKKIINKSMKRPLLEGVLWGLKLKGCAISEEEINEILMEKFK